MAKTKGSTLIARMVTLRNRAFGQLQS